MSCPVDVPPKGDDNHPSPPRITPPLVSLRCGCFWTVVHAFRAWASPTRSGRGSWSAHDGAVALPFVAAWNCVRVALSLDASSSDGGGSSGTRTEPVHLPCRLVAWSPAKALGGSSGIGRWTICFAPCVVHPPPSCARSSRASGHPLRTRGGPSHQLSAPLSSPPYICIHIYVHTP